MVLENSMQCFKYNYFYTKSWLKIACEREEKWSVSVYNLWWAPLVLCAFDTFHLYGSFA